MRCVLMSALLTWALVLAGTTAAQDDPTPIPQIEIDDTAITLGQQVTVHLVRGGAPWPGAPIVAIYRPCLLYTSDAADD